MHKGTTDIIHPYCKLPGFLILIAMVFAAGLIVYGVLTFNLANFQQIERGGEDLRCYYAIVERIHAGEGYYQATQKELQSRGYTTSSVFNWRMPFLAMLLGQLPTIELARLIAMLLSLLSLWLWIDVAMNRMSILRVAAGVIPIAGFTIYGFLGIIFFMHEYWAGLLISISLFFYAKGCRKLSVISGILALFIRELALPFIAAMLLISFVEHKRRESAIWLAGIFTFIAAYIFHAMQVNQLTKGIINVDFGQWLAFGGWNYVLATTQLQPFLLISSSWCAAVLAPLALVGFLEWRDTLGKRMGLTITAYITIFLFVGNKNNAYWGLLYCNLVPLGLLYTNVIFANAFSTSRAKKLPQEF